VANRKQLIACCRRCKRERADGERFSARGVCEFCSENRPILNRRQLISHAGPFFDHWRQACAAAFGVVPVDADPPADET
jgi:hypothetical protein